VVSRLSPADNGTPLEKGKQALGRGDLVAAQRAFEEAVHREPENTQALKFLGQAYSAQEKFREAEGPLRKACTLNPAEENACYYLGRLLYTVGRLAEARSAFDRALTQRAGRGRALDGLALTLEAGGDFVRAEQRFREAIAAGGSTAPVDYGLFLFRQGRLRESEEALARSGAKAELARVRKAGRESPAGAGVPVPPVQVRFDESTLPMIVKNGATGDKHLPETMLGGVAVFDFDNDGWPDIFVANGATMPGLEKVDASFRNRLFRNNRDGTFTDVTVKAGVGGAGYSMGVAAADFDNDGWIDLAVTGLRGTTLYRNRGDGSFEDVTARSGLSQGRWAVAAGWFDYDNDGWLDLFVVNYVAWDPAAEPFCGDHPPGGRTYCHPRFYSAQPNALFHNERNGTFRDVSRESGIAAHLGKGMGVAFGDYDGDGRLDVIVTNDTMPNFLFHNQGDGTFREVGLAAGIAYNEDGNAVSAMGLDFRDYDNDGREDAFITTLTNESFSLLRNMGDGQFANLSSPSRIASASMPWTGWGVGLYDFNNDGWKDAFVACGHVQDNAELTSSRQSRQPNLLFLNAGNGTFSPEALSAPAFHRGVAFGDFDRDGRMDAVVTRLNQAPLLLRNVTRGAGHWIELKLVGTRSNRDGIGAAISIKTPAGKQWNRVTTSVGYSSSSDRVVHFGLNRETVVQSMDIVWPSGVKQRCEGVAADRLITIREGSSCDRR
jgi:Tfp pilus assembly protein PilF